MHSPELEVDKARLCLETAEEFVKLTENYLLEVENRRNFYRRELQRLISENFAKGESA